MLTRRSLLAAPALLASACVPERLQPLPETAGPTLRAQAAAKGFVFGAAGSRASLNDRAFAGLFAAEAGMLVPENELKWGGLRPSEATFRFETADSMLDFAAATGLQARGHTLVWHEGWPDWLTDALAAGRGPALLDQHIERVVTRYRGRLHSWDVVNEAIRLNDSPGHLRNSPWLQAMGPRYIDQAFRVARAADSQAVLVYNDFGIDDASPPDGAKRAAVLELVADLKARGVPIDAVGTQAHLRLGQTLDQRALAKFASDVRSLGLKLLVTELDVRDFTSTGTDAARDQAIADHVRRFLDPLLADPATTHVLTWGLSDRYSWLNAPRAQRRQDGRPQRGLPFDQDLARKPMWAALARAFRDAPAR
jgi:endo-1,4-beta-xylanase